tara:strand:- start:1621 stop:2157 length:537 start_codon:yes stop_codon:yes gene_type:complete
VPLPFLPLLAMSEPDFVPFQQPAPAAVSPLLVEPVEPFDADRIQVNEFDPTKRARLMAVEMPRQWSGNLRQMRTSQRIPAELTLKRLVPLGEVLDLFGTISIGGKTVPVQGNINMNSDQLTLLLLGDDLPAGLEAGGNFLGLQMFKLSRWVGPRITSRGHVLELDPLIEAQPPVRGLW